MKELTLEPVLSDEAVKKLEGKFLDESYIKHLLDEDTIVYNEHKQPLAVFRKNCLPSNQAELAYHSLKKSIGKTSNRGKAGGNFNFKVGDVVDGSVVGKVLSGNRFIPLKKDGTLSNSPKSKNVNSSIIGYADRYPRIPYCRTTLYTGADVERWEKCMTYINKTDEFFKELLPNRYAAQKRVAETIDPQLRIGDTAFTTVTINNNFRTACHRDAGDLKEGFGNLSCTGKGEWDGGYTILPEYRVGVKLNPGDVLIMDVHQIHGNTAIREKNTGREAKFIGNKKNEDFAVDFERVSLVCYLRENMTECGSKVYEDLRKQYVQDRINDKEHPDHSKYVHRSQTWNGVSPGMWEEDAWVDYLRKHGFDAEADELRPTVNTIDSLFA